MSRLATGQREIARLLRAPEGVRAALAEAADPRGRSLAARVRGDARLDATRRLEVYANAVFHRIRETLEDQLDVLARAVGPAGFNDLVAVYLMAHPPHHPSLREAGAALPGFLARHAAAEGFRRRWPWAADLARLEWALGRAFDAADAPTATRAALERLAPEAWDGLVLRFQPSAQLLRVDWPVQRWLGAEELAALEAPQPGAVLVWRRGERPRHRSVEPLEAELLERGLAGEPFGALCACAAGTLGDRAGAARSAAWLAGWVDAGLLAA